MPTGKLDALAVRAVAFQCVGIMLMAGVLAPHTSEVLRPDYKKEKLLENKILYFDDLILTNWNVAKHFALAFLVLAVYLLIVNVVKVVLLVSMTTEAL